MGADFDMERLKQLVDAADVVSFDVFDTMLLRIVNTPETIFELTGRACRLDNFSAQRQEMQQQAGRKAERELHLPHADMNQIYEYMAQHMDGDISWDSVRKLEMQAELDALVVNPEIYEVYAYARNAGKRVIAVSDMYLDGAFLEKALRRCGYEMDRIYDSADVHRTKFRGDMFPYVLQMEQTEPGRLVHIGDNYASDVKNARKAGITAYYYARESGEEPALMPPYVGAGLLNRMRRQKLDFWQRLGAEAGGPLYLGLITWLCERLEKEDPHKIFFMSRDGYNLYHLFLKYTDVPAAYLYTSRRALLLAGIQALDEEALAVLPPFTFGQTVREVLEYLDVLEICRDSAGQAGFESLSSRIQTPADIEKVKRMYQLNEKAFLDKCSAERDEAQKYFSSIGFFEEDSLVFDCGWNGSSQFLLERFLSAVRCPKKQKFYYTGILDTHKSRRQLRDKMFEAYLFSCGSDHALQEKVKDATAVMELFFGAPEESVLFYKNGSPVFEKTEADFDYRRKIYEGIEAYIGCGLTFVKKYHIPIPGGHAAGPLLRLIHAPAEEEAVRIGSLPNVDGFAKQEGEDKYLAYVTADAYKNNPKIEIYWMQGLMKRPDIALRLKKRICADRGLDICRYLTAAPKQAESAAAAKEPGFDNDRAVRKFLKENPPGGAADKDYQEWIKAEESKGRKQMPAVDYAPLISFVVPVYNVKEEHLAACIESVRRQTYEHWELWLVDDCSDWKCVRECLHRYEGAANIHIIYRTENGNIAAATNDGIAEADGEFIAFMDCDDTIAEDALQEMVLLLNKNREYDFIYSDEDKLSEDGSRRHSPFFKPDWSPDTFMSLMYTNHLAIYRTALVRKAGGLRTEFNGAQDYDFTLRFMELSDNRKVGHAARVLYHWREREGSIASEMQAKPYALSAMKRLKEEALKRRHLNGSVQYVNDICQYRVVYAPQAEPLVSVIIPSKDHPDILRQCIDSIRKYTEYKNYEIIVVDNGSREDNRRSIKQYLEERHAAYIYEPMEFNFSKMCNIGVRASKGAYVLLLNDDIEVFQKDWMSVLLGQAMLDHAGAAGAKLLYPHSDIIQHTGITNLKIGPSHSLLGFSDAKAYYFGRNRAVYNWLAVSAACLMIKKSRYEQAGGMDERLAVAYNDVDFCFRLHEQGYYNCVRSDVCMYHHESLSRGPDDSCGEKQRRLLEERRYLYDRHPGLEGKDPFYNVNLTPDRVDFRINSPAKSGAQAVLLRRRPKRPACRKFQVCIDQLREEDELLRIEGWCRTGNPKRDNRSRRYLLLVSETGRTYRLEMEKVFRPDVAQAVDAAGCLAGFQAAVSRNMLMMDAFTYRIGIMQQSGLHAYICWLEQRTQNKPCRKCSICRLSRNEKDLWKKKDMLFHIDEYQSAGSGLSMRGWAVVKDADNLDYATQIYIEAEGGAYLCDAHAVWRHDIALLFAQMSNVYLCGFEVENLDVGNVTGLWLLKKNLRTGQVFFTAVDEGQRQEHKSL